MKRLSLVFTEPYTVAIDEEDMPRPGAGQVLVETLVSAISPGTEMLVYRGQFPADMTVDSAIPSLPGRFRYPMKYGYACVGQVMEVGSMVNSDWLDRLVFGFNPHESHFVSPLQRLIPLPDGLNPEIGSLLPNMETAVNLVMDGRPLIGERIAVFGQGVVGLLTTAVLSKMSPERLVTLDRHPIRRDRSAELGADFDLDPELDSDRDMLRHLFDADEPSGGADLTFELSGAPEALDDAIKITGFDGRVVVGSWYGNKTARLNLGGHFHRNRIEIVSSQVSTLSPARTGRWTKARRIQLALRMLERTNPVSLITHRFSPDRAAGAYALIDKQPESSIQVLISYTNHEQRL